ncbi:Hpt domain-containing protein [Rhodoferax sp. OV413]|uniref:hybrid sensor histidine kinase/response regulator n=1 Tax=Rhodoferax sp. OV413 TaxID=1855285 RepID=UPI0025F36707|nr:Hpt domain-containing protein [Rhodoferax sp. OV413]
MSSSLVAHQGQPLSQADLGPLAWVLEELRKSLDGATKAVRRFVRDAELAQSSDPSLLDASHLRIARQQLHQSAGALEMIGLEAPAKFLRAMEVLAHKCVQRPEICNDAVAGCLERASFALNEYLEGLLKGKSASPVALFPQYKALLDLGGAERIHPADLWVSGWEWKPLALPEGAKPHTTGPELRGEVDHAILRLMKYQDPAAARRLQALSVGLAAAAQSVEEQAFWMLGAAYFEGTSYKLFEDDIYTKRTASRILQQYVARSKGRSAVSERLAQDIVFFCSRANPADVSKAPTVAAVRLAYGLTDSPAVDYAHEQFGRFDPALLVLARKRIAAAAETWSALAGGDLNRLKAAGEQFAAVSDVVIKLHGESAVLARALTSAVDAAVRSGASPSPALAMEVATAVLYLEAAYDDLDPADNQMAERGARLAQRLQRVMAGGLAEPLEAWMEDLYRRVSERQTMGSVVNELRGTLDEVEKALDQFFRDPGDNTPLREVPSQLSQMRGVFSVLGLDQPALAALRIRSSVEQFMVDTVDAATARTGIFEKLGNSLGALGFLIDMLSYQRALARTLFEYDELAGEFRPLMGREREAIPAPAAAAPAAAAPGREPADDDGELLDVFLQESREVLLKGQEALAALRAEPTNLADQTTLRRAFHTLKGSSRMVGLHDFGEAAWAYEQLLNANLADHKPASEALMTSSTEALAALARWSQAIAAGDASAWSPAEFRKTADALRLGGEWLPLQVPPDALDAEPEPEVVLEFPPMEEALEVAIAPEPEPEPVASPAPAEPQVQELDDWPDMEDAEEVAPAVEVKPAAVLEAESLLDSLEFSLDDFDFDEPDDIPAAATPADPLDTDAVEVIELGEEEPQDEGIKVIGSLRISIPLYNVYLNEADEWSRRLQTELGEWSIELAAPVSDSVISLSHSLLGSSSTVGFMELSNLARLLEQALQHVQLHRQIRTEHAAVFCDAAQEIRRLLHQFAAGFVKEADPVVLEALHAIIDTEFAAGEPDAVSAGEPDQPVALPVAAPLRVLDAQDVALESQDSIDPDLLLIFEEEAAELMPQLGAALREWVASPEQPGPRRAVLRLLHTLKGSARLAGAMRFGEMAHRMESSIEQLGSEGLQTVQLEPLLTRFDALQATLDALAQTGVDAPDETPARPEAGAASPALPVDTAQAKSRPLVHAPASFLPRAQAHQTVRVRAQLLDRLVNQAGEVMMSRSRMDERLGQLKSSLGELTGNLDRLRQQLRDVELQAESQMQSRLAQTKDSAQGFDPLEFDRFTRVQELTRMMAESVNDVATVQRALMRSVEGTEDDLVAQARQARELQKDLLRTRMVEFDSIADRLYGVVRQAAKDAGKQVKLDIAGGSIEVDRGVLDRMAAAFEHLLRNAVAHGIEAPAQRTRLGKPATGTISIALQQESNDIIVRFSDDGAGLDMEGILAKARANGLVGPEDTLSVADAANLIFAPGFSTADVVTELSGRGIGMDVVRSEVQALGGRIETQTEVHVGTTFALVLPLTTAVTQVVIMRMGDYSIGVPASLMETVLRVPAGQVEAAYASQSFEFGGEQVPFYWGGALLQTSARSEEPAGKTRPVAIFRSAGQRLAAHIDEVLGNREVVVKNLGPQLARLPGLSGMSVLASGAVVLIYNPVALVSVYGDQARALAHGHSADEVARLAAASPPAADGPALAGSAAPKLPLVMVVDDSITVRRVTQRLLKREGYRVVLANDGLQALERLQEEAPVVVLTDIEMPRMDGFDLARNIRADAKLSKLPIIMITSRIAEKHREHARSLGVDHYLGKPYSEDELLALVRDYCALAPVEASADFLRKP